MSFDLDRARYAIDGLKSRLTTMDKRPLVIIGVGTPIALVLVIVLVVSWTGGGGETITPSDIPEARSRPTMDDLIPSLAADPRFTGVRVVPSRADEKERLLIMGSVASATDLDALKARVTEADPPVPVEYQVAIAPTDN